MRGDKTQDTLEGGEIIRLWHSRTVGRPKRRRKPGSGTAVSIRRHTRSPRGPNGGKKRVTVDSYRRGAGKRTKKGRRRRG